MARVQCPPPLGKSAMCCARSAGLQISVVIRKANHFIRVSDINPLRVRSRRIKRNSVRLGQPVCEDLHLFRLAVGGHPAKNADAPRVTFRQKNVAVRRGPQPAWTIQPARIEFYLESRRRDRPRVLWTRHHLGSVLCGIRRVRLRKILHRDLSNRPWRLVTKVRKGRMRRFTLHPFGARCVRRRRARHGTRFACRQSVYIGHNLPPLRFRQRRPRGHSIFLAPLGDEPEHFAFRHALQLAVDQRRHIARTLSCLPVAGQAISRVDSLTRVRGGLLSRKWILHCLRRLGRIVKGLVRRVRHRYGKDS